MRIRQEKIVEELKAAGVMVRLYDGGARDVEPDEASVQANLDMPDNWNGGSTGNPIGMPEGYTFEKDEQGLCLNKNKKKRKNARPPLLQCGIDGCTFECKLSGHLKQHKMHVHDIGIVWHHCGINGCTYKAKNSSNLKQHKSDVHEIGVTWHHCDVNGCTFKSKRKFILKTHKRRMH